VIKIKNTHSYNNLRERLIGGKITGIWKNSSNFIGNTSFPIPKFYYQTSNFSEFEKNYYSKPQELVYHLSGYGNCYNESLVSFLGEASERYSYAANILLVKDRIIFDSYDNLKELDNAHYLICPLEYINVYYNEKDEKNFVRADDKISWIKMISLTSPDKEVLIPLQFFIPYNDEIFKNEKKILPSAVSTGTSSHETIRKSLENCIIEYFQIDSFNLWWYGGVQGKTLHVNPKDYIGLLTQDEKEIKTFLDYYTVEFTDISFDKGIDIVVCEIFGKDKCVPQYTIGVQGGKDYKKAIYRSFMEAITVLEYNNNIPWIETDKYLKIGSRVDGVGNLDDNVIWYSKYGKQNTVKHDNINWKKSIDETKEHNIFNKLKELSKYTGMLNITLTDFNRLNLNVIRVIIPELLPMCLPSYPQYYHARYKSVGGVINNIIHPLA